MIIKSKINGYSLVSPISVVLITIFIMFLSTFENPMNWTANYSWSGELDYTVLICYVLFVILGIFLGSVFNRNRYNDSNEVFFDLKINTVFLMFGVACFFQFAKFVNIGDIPLLGDPSSRYKLTLGGFEDYPSRLLAPLSAAMFLLYLSNKKNIYLCCVLIGFFANLMLLQRQEILNLVLSCLIIYFFTKTVNLSKIVTLGLACFVSLYLLIGVGAILRFGADNMLSNSNIFLLPLYVLHADMTTAIIFGQSVSETLGDRTLNGAYAFGSYISIFIPGYTDHGAELIRKEFTNSTTAQSLGIPFAYFVDFGYSSLIILAFTKGFVLQYFYNKAISDKKLSNILFYIIIYLNALWALRAGTIIVTPICLYLGLFIVVAKQSENLKNTIMLNDVIKIMFIFSLIISLTALIIRI
ncbi:MAG: oligosaccharide repeat unit polymerase [Colwellia sp.]|jgi:oligosaccharide repeat unit polymerase